MSQESVLEYEIFIRISFFFGVLACLGFLEWLAPRRILQISKLQRWLSNLGLVFFNSVLLRLLFPAAAVGMAGFAEANGWGLLNYYALPLPLAVLIGVVFLDIVIYLQHIMLHAVPLFWRLHQVHHADMDFDLTTGVRFHPLEILLSMLIKFATIIVIGAPILAVVIFEVLLNATSMFNHSNINIPQPLDRILRSIMVTPDMHRVHHSIEEDETNSNFGFNLSIWDRLFGTYRDQPRAGHIDMTIGIRNIREPVEATRFNRLILMPFHGTISGYTINKRWK